MVVVFQIAGERWPLENHFAETLATALRVSLVTGSDTPNIAGSVFLADAIESALVGASTEPIPLDEDAAESLFYQLNVTLKNPEPVDTAYAFTLKSDAISAAFTREFCRAKRLPWRSRRDGGRGAIPLNVYEPVEGNVGQTCGYASLRPAF